MRRRGLKGKGITNAEDMVPELAKWLKYLKEKENWHDVYDSDDTQEAYKIYDKSIPFKKYKNTESRKISCIRNGILISRKKI